MKASAISPVEYEALPSHTKAAVDAMEAESPGSVMVDENGYLVLRTYAPDVWTPTLSKPICPECGVAPEMVEVHIEWHRRAETQYTATRRRISAVSAQASR